MNHSSEGISEKISEAALSIGFDRMGIASAEPSSHGDNLDRWLSEGRHGDMAWMARDPARRKNVQHLMPGARSVVVVALNYHVPVTDDSSGGVVARYARGRDYHKTMQKMLERLAGEIEAVGGEGTMTRVALDTSAVLERELAQRAGIGWIGKSTVALTREWGTWFLLGEVVTNLPLKPDEPAVNRCGSCQRCIDACPTRAITAPYQLDARRCIAYLTIECKGDIPVEFRTAMGNRIFGCDDCLAVCPWNRFAREARAFRETYRADLVSLNPRELLEMNAERFEAKFSGTPIRRLGLERLQRNAAVVLGNIGTANDLRQLYWQQGSNPSVMVRRHASWAWERLRHRI